jgi:hypothetical protein
VPCRWDCTAAGRKRTGPAHVDWASCPDWEGLEAPPACCTDSVPCCTGSGPCCTGSGPCRSYRWAAACWVSSFLAAAEGHPWAREGTEADHCSCIVVSPSSLVPRNIRAQSPIDNSLTPPKVPARLADKYCQPKSNKCPATPKQRCLTNNTNTTPTHNHSQTVTKPTDSSKLHTHTKSHTHTQNATITHTPKTTATHTQQLKS